MAGASGGLALSVGSALAQQGFPSTLNCSNKQRAYESAGRIITVRNDGSYVVDFRRGEITQRLGGTEVRYAIKFLLAASLAITPSNCSGTTQR